jgi:predicted dienelactone hydrolase
MRALIRILMPRSTHVAVNTVIGLLLVTALTVRLAFGADVSGTWSGTIAPEGESRTDRLILMLQQDGERLTGTAGPNEAERHNLENGIVQGDRVSFEVTDAPGLFVFDLRVSGEEMNGRLELKRGAESRRATVALKRIGTAAAAVRPAARPRLPAPTGPYGVGRTAFYFSRDGQGNNETMIYVWYPAAKTAGETLAPYIPGWSRAGERIADSLKRALGPTFEAHQANPLMTHATGDAPVAGSGRYPLLLFMHGTGVASLTYAAQLEELASHGYVIAAVEYLPATAGFVVLPDGRITQFDPERWRNTGSTPEERLNWEKKQIDDAADALRFTLDNLVRMNSSGTSLLRGRLALSQIGVVGHSFGGMVALRLAQVEPRIQACIVQDGLSNGMVAFAVQGVEKPCALMFRPVPEESAASGDLARLFDSLPATGLMITIGGPQFEHMSFSDLPLLRAADAERSGHAVRGLAVVREFSRRFLDVHLKHLPSSTIAADLEIYPEVALKRAVR